MYRFQEEAKIGRSSQLDPTTIHLINTAYKQQKPVAQTAIKVPKVLRGKDAQDGWFAGCEGLLNRVVEVETSDVVTMLRTIHVDSVKQLWKGKKATLDQFEMPSNLAEGLIQGGKELGKTIMRGVSGVKIERKGRTDEDVDKPHHSHRLRLRQRLRSKFGGRGGSAEGAPSTSDTANYADEYDEDDMQTSAGELMVPDATSRRPSMKAAELLRYLYCRTENKPARNNTASPVSDIIAAPQPTIPSQVPTTSLKLEMSHDANAANGGILGSSVFPFQPMSDSNTPSPSFSAVSSPSTAAKRAESKSLLNKMLKASESLNALHQQHPTTSHRPNAPVEES